MSRWGNMAERAIDKQPARRRQSLFERLRDRLRGGAAAAVGDEPESMASGMAPAPTRIRLPPPDRLTVLQWLHGPGFLIPGDATYVLEIVKPFHLSPAMTMLDLAAGLGGPARAIAEAFNTYVTGYERDSAL